MMHHETRLEKQARNCSVASLARCPACGDLMVAPVVSEFVETGEIRHYWECEACGEYSVTSIPLTTH